MATFSAWGWSLKGTAKFSDYVVSGMSLSEMVKSFRRNGIAVFKVPTTAPFAPAVGQWKNESAKTLQAYLAKAAAAPGRFGVGKELGFRELVQKDSGRYDMNFDHLIRGGGEAEGDENFVNEIVRGEMAKVAGPLFQELFGPHYRVNGQGVVVSQPGAEAQGWHVDSSWLFEAHPSQDQNPTKAERYRQPCHFVTCFMPLYQTRTELGPTEFVVGSHKRTHVLGRDTVADQYPSPAVAATLAAHGEVLQMEAAPGDIVVMDGRMLHRGLGNSSSEVRHLVYASFCPPWYCEWPRSQSSHRSLFKAPGQAIPE